MKPGRTVAVPPWNDADPYTTSARLCDDDGIVRKGLMHHGTDYICTGHAHFAGDHIRCESPGHPGNLPAPVLDALRESVMCIRDGDGPPGRTWREQLDDALNEATREMY